MTKAPLGGRHTGPNPTDRAKRGRNDRSSPRASGVPVGIADEGANRNDHLLARPTLASIPIGRPAATDEQPQGLCLDAAYDNSEVRELAASSASPRNPLTRRRKKALASRLASAPAAGSSSAPTPGSTAPSDPDPLAEEADRLAMPTSPAHSSPGSNDRQTSTGIALARPTRCGAQAAAGR